MADPSMDRQEFYVAASRSREETHFYATPEVRLEREEIAPDEPGRGKGLEHIARAAERDGAQVSAHEQALRSKLAELPSPELHGRLDGLLAEISAERMNEQAHALVAGRIERTETWAEHAAAAVDRVAELSRRQRKREEDRVAETARDSERAVEDIKTERSRLPEIRHDARAEASVIEHLLAERERARLTAVRVSPPDYIIKELGERPSDPVKRREWDGAVRGDRALPRAPQYQRPRARARPRAEERGSACPVAGRAASPSAEPARAGPST